MNYSAIALGLNKYQVLPNQLSNLKELNPTNARETDIKTYKLPIINRNFNLTWEEVEDRIGLLGAIDCFTLLGLPQAL